MSDCISLSVEISGLSEFASENIKFDIYPNPAKDRFTISTEAEAKVIIVNSIGQKVKLLDLNSMNGYTLEIYDLKPGVYILTAQIGNTYNTRKVIISG